YSCPFGFTNPCPDTCCSNNVGIATNSLFSVEGFNYAVNTTTLTLNEFDNALGGETVLWSNPLTNSFDSTNWTLVFANINLGSSPTNPIVVSNYNNSANTLPNTYFAAFGKPVADDSVPPSSTMTANGWSSALKVTVNKNPNNAGEAGINLYPQAP